MKSQEVNFAAIKLRRHQTGSDDGSGVAALPGRRSGRRPQRSVSRAVSHHQGEGRDAFHVDMRRKIFHCFSCGAGGDVLDLVALLNQCTLREAAWQLQDWLPGAATRTDRPARQRVTKEISVTIHR